MAEYTIGKNDFMAASWFVQRKYRRVHGLWALLVATLCGIYVGMRGLGTGPAVMVGALVVLVGVGGRWLLHRRKIARVYDDHLADSPQVSLTVDDRGVELRREVASVRMGWKQLKFWSENERYLLLYQGKDYAQIIVKEALSTEEEALIRLHLEGVKRI